MQFRGMEDRLNPIAPVGADETTLGGYAAVHGRAAAFEGSDGLPYTAAIEAEANEDRDGTWAAYLVFVRWAADSTAIMGHLETEDLARAASETEARAELEGLPLVEIKRLLDEAILRHAEWQSE